MNTYNMTYFAKKVNKNTILNPIDIGLPVHQSLYAPDTQVNRYFAPATKKNTEMEKKKGCSLPAPLLPLHQFPDKI